MLRSFWQRAKDYVYDSVASLFRTQAEIDIQVENDLLTVGNVVYDIGDVPTGARSRKRTFLSPQDAITYVTDGGIPADYVTIEVVPDWDDQGNSAYVVWVAE